MNGRPVAEPGPARPARFAEAGTLARILRATPVDAAWAEQVNHMRRADRAAARDPWTESERLSALVDRACSPAPAEHRPERGAGARHRPAGDRLLRRVRAASDRMPTNDLWVAATALAQDLTLVTADERQAALPLVRTAARRF